MHENNFQNCLISNFKHTEKFASMQLHRLLQPRITKWFVALNASSAKQGLRETMRSETFPEGADDSKTKSCKLRVVTDSILQGRDGDALKVVEQPRYQMQDRLTSRGFQWAKPKIFVWTHLCVICPGKKMCVEFTLKKEKVSFRHFATGS